MRDKSEQIQQHELVNAQLIAIWAICHIFAPENLKSTPRLCSALNSSSSGIGGWGGPQLNDTLAHPRLRPCFLRTGRLGGGNFRASSMDSAFGAGSPGQKMEISYLGIVYWFGSYNFSSTWAPKKKSIHSLKHEPGTPAPSNSPSKSLTLTTSKSTPGSPSGDAWSVISEHEDPRHHFPTSLSLALHLTAYLCSQMLTANISTWPPTAKPMKEMILNDLLMFPCEPVGRAIWKSARRYMGHGRWWNERSGRASNFRTRSLLSYSKRPDASRPRAQNTPSNGLTKSGTSMCFVNWETFTDFVNWMVNFSSFHVKFSQNLLEPPTWPRGSMVTGAPPALQHLKRTLCHLPPGIKWMPDSLRNSSCEKLYSTLRRFTSQESSPEMRKLSWQKYLENSWGILISLPSENSKWNPLRTEFSPQSAWSICIGFAQ